MPIVVLRGSRGFCGNDRQQYWQFFHSFLGEQQGSKASPGMMALFHSVKWEPPFVIPMRIVVLLVSDGFLGTYRQQFRQFCHSIGLVFLLHIFPDSIFFSVSKVSGVLIKENYQT